MRVYISADYSESSGDRNVVEQLNNWSADKLRKVEFTDMSRVSSGSVSKNPDCRICDLKEEFNRQINASSHVIIVIGDKTSQRTAGSECERLYKSQFQCMCTPYKQNTNGIKMCKKSYIMNLDEDIQYVNNYSYLRHEFEESKKRKKRIIVVYNSLIKQQDWMPSYMKEYQNFAEPFWVKNEFGEKVGNYQFIKKALGYE